MILTLLVIFGILLEVIILGVGIYFILKKFPIPQPDKPIIESQNKNITAEMVRDGVKAALQEVDYEKEQEKSFHNHNKIKFSESIYTSHPKDVPVTKSGGNLVPYGLSDEDKVVLEMFYGK